MHLLHLYTRYDITPRTRTTKRRIATARRDELICRGGEKKNEKRFSAHHTKRRFVPGRCFMTRVSNNNYHRNRVSNTRGKYKTKARNTRLIRIFENN